MNAHKILLVTGPSCNAVVVKQLQRFLGATGYEVERHHTSYFKQLRERLWAALSRSPLRNLLSDLDTHDIIIGYRDGAQAVVDAASKYNIPIDIVLIEPTLPTDYVFPASIANVTLFHDTDGIGVTMGTLGHRAQENPFNVTVHAFDSAVRELGHWPTWVWKHILRTRLQLSGVLK